MEAQAGKIQAKKSYGVVARLVWDGGDEVIVPEEMGRPADDQMRGTPGERLTELCGRVCYDSLGKGRSSPDYHRHILEVGHFSVCEHYHITVRMSPVVNPWAVVNRPGIWARQCGAEAILMFNPRVVLDWDQWSREIGVHDMAGAPGSLGNLLSYHAERLCPVIVARRERGGIHEAQIREWSGVAAPEHDEERWISLFLSGSRGWSHEQVRHRFRSAVSQRSTRFVAEDGSPWLDHPLVQEFLASGDPLPGDPEGRVRGAMSAAIGDAKECARGTYGRVAERLQGWLLSKGVDKAMARKQARGAARGYLGNALWTEMVFGASVAQWKRMLRLRCNDAADAEIRAVFAEALPALKGSRHGARFSAFRLRPAADWIGDVAVEDRGGP